MKSLDMLSFVRRVVLASAVMLLAVEFVVAATPQSISDPVLGTKQRPDPAMESVGLDTSPAKR